LCFRKATKEIFLELDKTKAKVPIFPKRDGVQRWDGWVHKVSRTMPWSGPPLATSGYGVGPWPTLWCRPSTYILPSTGKPKEPRSISMKHTASHRRRRCKIGRVQKLFVAPCRRGESPPKAFFITIPASGVMR
jgi:hypothetical protein